MIGHIRKLNPLLDEMGILRVGGSTGKRSNRLRCKASNHSALPRSRDRFYLLVASPENWSSGSRVRFVQPASPVLGNQGMISCASCDQWLFSVQETWCREWGIADG